MSDFLRDFLLDKANWYLMVALAGWVLGLLVSVFWKLRDGDQFYWVPPWWSFIALGIFYFFAAVRDEPRHAQINPDISGYYYLGGIAVLVGLAIGLFTRFRPFGRLQVGAPSNTEDSFAGTTIDEGPNADKESTLSPSVRKLLEFTKESERAPEISKMEVDRNAAGCEEVVSQDENGDAEEEKPRMTRRVGCIAALACAIASPVMFLIARSLYRWVANMPGEKTLGLMFVFLPIGFFGIMAAALAFSSVIAAWHCAFGKSTEDFEGDS